VKKFERLQIHFALALSLFFGFDSLIHSEKPVSAQKRYQFESPQMGVPFRLVIYTDRGASHASDAAGKVWGRISFLNNILSNYETDSELSRLGYGAGQGIWTHVSDERMRSDFLFHLEEPLTLLWGQPRHSGGKFVVKSNYPPRKCSIP
jgi:hypothetical protein